MAATWLKRLFGASKLPNAEIGVRPSARPQVDSNALGAAGNLISGERSTSTRSPQELREAQLNQLTRDAMVPRYFGGDDISYGHINERIYRAKNQLIGLLVTGESDQAALFSIARTHPVPEVREAAVRNLTDQKMLELFLRQDDSDESILYKSRRAAAVKNLTDQAILLSIAQKRDEDNYVRETAVRQLTDQATLAGIALSLSDLDCRRAAVESLTDQTLLAKVAVEGGTPWIRQKAVGKISASTAPPCRAAAEHGHDKVVQ